MWARRRGGAAASPFCCAAVSRAPPFITAQIQAVLWCMHGGANRGTARAAYICTWGKRHGGMPIVCTPASRCPRLVAALNAAGSNDMPMQQKLTCCVASQGG